MKLWKLLKAKMLLNSNQTICEKDLTFTFEEFVLKAEEFAKQLKGLKCCAILCDSQIYSALALLSCFCANVTAIPLSKLYGELHCNKIIDAINPEAIITQDEKCLMVNYCRKSTYMAPKKNPALIMCTSGTTGIPKGVMLTEKNIIANISDIVNYFAINQADTILISRPLYHCAVLTGEFLTSLVKGVNIRFYSEKFNSIKLLDLLYKQKITVFCTTPTLLCLIICFIKRSSIDFLKHICISGECISKQTGTSIANAFPNCDIYHVYGLTEACPRVSYLPPEYFKDYADCVGLPLDNVSIKVLNRNGKTCKANEEGILWVKGKNIMMGYYNNQKTTRTVLKRGWLCTGDIATVNEIGFLKILGRKDNLIIKAGMNIYPTEVENALKTDPRTKEVLIYGYQGEYLTQIGLKIVGDFFSTDEVRKMCAELLPTFQVPKKIEIVKELPKNASGKIIRNY